MAVNFVLPSSSMMKPSTSMEIPGLVENMSKLTQESELQKMLADEKMRGEMHKTNYQTLKAEHTRVQDDLRRLQNKMEKVKSERKSAEERLQTLMAKANKELAEKSSELEDLRSKVLTPQKLELIKLKIAEELEQPFRERLGQLSQDVEHYREEFNKLRYENTFLKSEYEHEQGEHKRISAEIKTQYEAEIDHLRKDKEAIIARYSQDNSQDADKVRNLHRDNAQLNLKVKGLLNELEEIRAQREQAGLQSDHVTRLQARQLSEHTVNVKALETEKESIKLHMEQLQKELSASQDEHRSLSTKIHDLERQNSELRVKLEETDHLKKLEGTNSKMEILKIRGELERERDLLHNELEGYKAKLEVIESSLQTQSNLVVEKEKEIARKVQAAREEEWERMNQLETEKLDLEARLQEMEKSQSERESQRLAEKTALEDRVMHAEQRKDEVEKELLVVRTKLEQQRSLQEQLDHEQQQAVKNRDKLQQKLSELHAAKALEQELNLELERLRSITESLKDELREVRYEAQKDANTTQSQADQQKLSWLDEKQQFQRRIEDLERQVQSLQKKGEEEIIAMKKKKKRYQRIVDKLKDKLQLLEAQKEELELEKQALRNQIPKDTYTKAVRKLRDLQRKHTDFKHLMTSMNVSHHPIGPMSFAAASLHPPPEASTPLPFHHNQNNDLANIKERLHELSENQRLQMDALMGKSARTDTYFNFNEEDAKENLLSPVPSKIDLEDL